MSQVIAGNYFDKYRSKKLLHRVLMKRFLSDAIELASQAEPSNVLEVGCGSGDLAAAILPSIRTAGTVHYLGIDISDSEVAKAKSRNPDLSFKVASATSLPFSDRSHDLVIACEVLEHVDDADMAMREVARVTRQHAMVSVPWEPAWRLLNCARGQYLANLGNTPGHVRHFSRRSIRELCGKHMKIIDERRPFPWTMLLLENRHSE